MLIATPNADREENKNYIKQIDKLNQRIQQLEAEQTPLRGIIYTV